MGQVKQRNEYLRDIEFLSSMQPVGKTITIISIKIHSLRHEMSFQMT